MHEHPVLQRRRFFHGRPVRDAKVKDIMWLAPSGHEMTDAEWTAAHVSCLGVRLAGDAIAEVDERGRPIVGATLVYLLNAGSDAVPFHLPAFAERPTWECLIDTFDESRVGVSTAGGKTYELAAHSLALFVLNNPGSPGTRR
jgi:glycogen operon protein